MASDRIPEDSARAIWRRAAQLQAEAESRVEERARQIPVATGADSDGDSLQIDDVRSAARRGRDIHRSSFRSPWRRPRRRAGPPWRWRDGTCRVSRLFLGASRRIDRSHRNDSGKRRRGLGLPACTCSPDIPASSRPEKSPSSRPRPAESLSSMCRNSIGALPANPPFVEKAAMVGLKQLHLAIRPLGRPPADL